MSALKSNIVVIASVTFFCSIGHAVEVNEAIKYDELGRLIEVKKNNSVEVAYCYDAAGNRKNVNRNGTSASDCADSLPVPPKPTNLSQGSHMGGGCYFSWSSSSSAVAYFEIKLEGLSTLQRESASTRYSDHNTRCADWIRACNADDACSASAYF